MNTLALLLLAIPLVALVAVWMGSKVRNPFKVTEVAWSFRDED